ncbi:MAG TPA: CHASE3 domain-containing protein [Steroidobacteraceae bacterium]|nr:CHASE3 domain-containing protein [Steroidobacteraceae bacterium]
MKRSRSIAGIAVVISTVVIIGAGMVAHRTIDRLSNASDAVLRAQGLELDYERLLSTVRDAETGQRGYLLTGDPGYLAPYDAAMRELEQRMKSVTDNVAADGGPSADLQPLRSFVQLKLAEMTRTVEQMRAGQRDAALDVVRSDQGRQLMEDIRSFVGDQVREQERRVARLQKIAGEALDASARAGVVVSLLAILLTLALVYIVRRDSRRVRESETRLAITLRSIGDAVIATDRRGVITMANAVAERLTGWPSREAVGRPLDEVFRILNEGTRNAVESPVTKVLREGGIVGLANHTLLIRRDGEETPIEDSGAPILDDAGQVIGVVLVFRDATHERAANKALREADRRKDEFLATLAHELRNPLAPIRQAANTAAHPAASDEQVKWSLGVIQRQVTHMARLLDDLLDVSRITRGKLEVRRVRVTLRSIVESAVEIVQPVINAGRHELSIELPMEPFELEVDPLRVAQVLGNLLTNAARYTPSGGRIRLSAERDGGDVLIRVIDNGIGIEATDLRRIFDMFTQVSATRERPNAGLGIGLALAKALVELHGGTIEAKSAGPGLGSEFIVRLALAQ